MSGPAGKAIWVAFSGGLSPTAVEDLAAGVVTRGAIQLRARLESHVPTSSNAAGRHDHVAPYQGPVATCIAKYKKCSRSERPTGEGLGRMPMIPRKCKRLADEDFPTPHRSTRRVEKSSPTVASSRAAPVVGAPTAAEPGGAARGCCRIRAIQGLLRQQRSNAASSEILSEVVTSAARTTQNCKRHCIVVHRRVSPWDYRARAIRPL